MSSANPEIWSRDLERLVREALTSIRFGTVTLVVQDGRVIQVDKNEKIRLNRQGHIDGSGI
ncbi:MAG: YezD family protein [Steroidobacteraceae bacterium]|nr:YezD family protein [Deltaproteobacteria bacterium]